MKPFRGVEPSELLKRFQLECNDENVLSLHLYAEVPPSRDLTVADHWPRFNSIVNCQQIRDAFDCTHCQFKPNGKLGYVVRYEIVGALANLLDEPGLHASFVTNKDEAFDLAREFLDEMFQGDYWGTEAYTFHGGWNDWFLDDSYLDETILIGRRLEWWLLAITAANRG